MKSQSPLVTCLLVTCVLAILAQACGSGGGSASTTGNTVGGTNVGGGSHATQPAGAATPTPPVGLATPTPGSAAVPTLIVPPGESIADVAKSAPAGTTIVVSPGLYAPVVFKPGELQDGIAFFADSTGDLTGTSPAPVTIDGQGHRAAVELSGQSNVSLDGFTLRGGMVASVLVENSPGTFVGDCIITGSSGDGARMDGADSGLLFNNLITNNGGAGIRVLATTGIDITNNTVYKNTQSGLTVGGPPDGASSNVVVENNIFDHNRPSGIGIFVDASTIGYQGDFNLNTDGYQGTSAGANDVHSDPLFIFPANGDLTSGADFHLAAGSAAINGGDSNTDASLASTLEQLTTQSDGTLDSPPPDLGYHYLPPVQPPTPAPRATKTHKAGSTGTVTPTRAGGGRATPTSTPSPATGGRTPKPTKTPRH